MTASATEKAIGLLPSLLLAVFAVLALGSAAGDSVTSDEVAHLPAGYTYVQTGDFRLNPQHPPLIKALAALPLLSFELARVDDVQGWAEGKDRIFGANFLVNNYEPLDRLLFAGRLAMIALGVFLGAVLFRWARELFGLRTALVTLFLYALSPNVLAHTRLVNTDVGIATFTVCALYALWKFTISGRSEHAALCGLALGSALLAKYSGLLTGVLVFALLAASLRFGRSPGEVARGGLWIAGVAALVVNVGYGFPTGLANYYRGFHEISRDFDMSKPAFLWGQHASGFWYYYLLAQLWKTPIPTLVLFAAALLTFVLRTERSRRDWLFVLAPIVAFHAAGTVFRPNIGVRHILPVFPFLFLAAGWAGARALDSGHRTEPGATNRRWRWVFLVLAVWYVLGTLRVYPHFLAYFNELAGGPAGGVRYLSDSNLEWGQDVAGMRAAIERRPRTAARVAVFAPLALESQGVIAGPIGLRDLVWPRQDVTYFVGTNHLIQEAYAGNRALRFRWLDRYRPVEMIGWSIYVYRFSTDPADRERKDVIFVPRERWYAEARAQLEAVLRANPQFEEARRLLAELVAESAASQRAEGGRS